MIAALLFLAALGASSQTFKNVEYNPEIAEIIDSVSEDSIKAVVAGLSGEVPVSIESQPDSIPCRAAYSPGCHKAALWLREQMENRWVGAQLRSFIPLEFSDVSLFDSGEGFACVRNAAAINNIFLTSDAGATWQPCGKFQREWEALDLLEGGTAYAISPAGYLAHMLKDTAPQILTVSKNLYDISFRDTLHGWAVGDSGAVLRTSNSGQSWSTEHIASDNLRKVDFTSLLDGWAASDTGLWVSDDGGIDWSYVGNPMQQITDISFTDSLKGWLVGLSKAGRGAVYATEDRGLHWKPLIDTLSYFPRAIDVVSPETIWVAGDAGLVLVSFDAGASWEQSSSGTRAVLTTIDFTADGRGAAAGAQEIVHSPDGMNWTRPDTSGLGLMWNVVGTIPGMDSTLVLLTAHYDTRSEDSLWTPGADDNGSGVSCVLEAARVLTERSWKHTLQFILFSGEEVGLLGSHRYVTESVGLNEDILAVINTDMMAYDSDDDRVMEINVNQNDARSPALAHVVLDVIDVYGLGLEPGSHIKDAKPNSDHYYFWQNMIPAVFLFEDRNDLNPFYHSTKDRLSALNMEYLRENVRAAVGSAAVMADADSLVEIYEKPSLPDEVVCLHLGSTIVTDRISLDIASPYPTEPCIYDAAGRKVRALEAAPSSVPTRIEVDVSDLPRGVYWISVSGVRGAVTRRFVIVR